MRQVAELLSDLVSISSISRESNRPMIEYIKSFLRPLGWRCDEHAYRDADGVEKVNLVAWPGTVEISDGGFELAIVCHTDTVPYSSDWKNATRLIEEGDALKGCGACDVKGFLAAMLATAESLQTTFVGKPFCIVLTADEEIGCLGARRLAESGVLRPKFAIVGEPTGLRPIRAGKGYCLADVKVFGREAHSAYPEHGESAIFRAARLITRIEAIADEMKAEACEDSPPWTTVNIGEIHGGLAKDIVPPSCSFLLEWRPIPQGAIDVIARVRDAIAGLTVEDAGFRAEVNVLREQEGFATDQASKIVRILSTVTGTAPGAVAFGTEAPWLAKMGAETVVFGPGSMHSAHSPREFVPKTELARCVEILRRAIQEVCA